jgi:hypothetical protein
MIADRSQFKDSKDVVQLESGKDLAARIRAKKQAKKDARV